ncbi:winged helix-turn-helix domain-containing protein [Pseudoalteromonas 'SMAR']|uniref:winged helix-turn-helix domain-containing protein n=1 Tax=Pseudoalteromonas 'SMAR' TaxID=3416908 RepID=UPI003AF1F1D8
MYKVGKFIFDTRRAVLITDGEKKSIEPQVNELLALLVAHAGEVVSKQQIIEKLWPERVITDDAFRAVIKKLRKCLQDSATSPEYIRTVTRKGYVLIADVQPVQSAAVKPLWLNTRALVVAIAIVAVLLYYLVTHTRPPTVTKLTDMAGSEVSPSYNLILNQLLYSHRSSKDDFLQLYAKNLSNGAITQLTNDQANFANAQFSTQGDKIAFTRSTEKKQQIFVADYEASSGIANVTMLPEAITQDKYLLAWSENSEGLYLSDNQRPLSAQGVWFYNLNTLTLNSITSPGGKAGGDYFARESYDGKWLAVLRHKADDSYELLIQHLGSGELSHMVKLPKPYTQLIWDQDGKQILLSSFNAEFARYDLSLQVLTPLNLGLANTNHAFFSCGKRCFYARQHNGNYTDVELQANPFNSRLALNQSYINHYGAENLPVSSPDGKDIFYIARVNNKTQLHYLKQNKVTVLHSFKGDAQTTALQLSPSGNLLAGTYGGRLFIFDLHLGHFNFVTTALEQVFAPVWLSRDQLSYARLESDIPVIYHYEVHHEVTVRDQSNYYVKIQQGNKSLFIDSSLTLWLQHNDTERVSLAQLQSASPNRWHIQGDWFYFTTRKENAAYLNRINLKTKQLEQRFLASNRYRLSFDFFEEGRTMLSVRSLLAESDLVKITF